METLNKDKETTIKDKKLVTYILPSLMKLFLKTYYLLPYNVSDGVLLLV